MTAPKVADVPLAKLTPAPWNPRTIRDERFKNLCESIQADPEFLWRRPILAMADGTIYAGNMRYRAATHLGLKAVPAIVEDVPEKLAKERALRDNAQWGDWHEDQLAEMVYRLAADGSDVKLLGIEDAELERLLDMSGAAGRSEGLTDPDELPEDVPTRSKRGDLWLLGEHRVLCGDATVAADVERVLGGNTPDALVSDPPYGINAVGKNGRIGASRLAETGVYPQIIGDDKPFDPTPFLGIAPYIVLFGANYFAERLPSSSGWLAWDKRGDMASNAFADCELAWTNQSRPARLIRCIWSGMIKQGESGERVHPTQKPVMVMGEILKDCGDRILDPFLGSGTTLIACEQLGRKCYGLEIEPKYVDVILQRWENFTGKTAVLA